MRRLLYLSLLGSTSVMAGTSEFTFENSNFTLNAPIDATNDNKFYNYNRFRATASFKEENWFLTSIGDVENYLGKEMINSPAYRANAQQQGDTPFTTKTGITNYTEGEYLAKLYRLYGGYANAKHRVSFGLQKISMGVGRIWNPTDLFNPKNPLALEPDEVYGAFSLLYTYALSDLSQVTMVVAEQEDHSYKYASRLKGYVGVADMGLNVISWDDSTLLGYEIEGELPDTGVALRSEGGWFEDRRLKESFFQGILGADYTFENSLSVAGEWLYSSQNFTKEELLSANLTNSAMPNNLMRSKSYAGLTMGYELNPLLYGTFVGITNTDDKSFYLSPALRYSLDDDMTLQGGTMLFNGKEGSEFGDVGETYYVNVKVTF